MGADPVPEAQKFTGFSGQALSLAGDKGRYVLPSAFRNLVKESSDGRVLCIDKHPKLDCLVGFGLSRHDELEAQLDREEDMAWKRGLDFDRDTRAAQLFGYMRVPFDDSGRFVMPSHLVRLGKIEDQLYFHGLGRFFTIWNPAELARMNDDWASAKGACADLVAEHEAKAARK
ncbi:division/cell wall cluster transcriptional repressor MraZ [Altererythrobacter sp. C41]|uniref:division/cell wall cluster transcriptional repressor MraZ n=1 Tax=Altererythrobacter sp. C41 TaxID=2806021 RepID=UPI001932BEC0|nr:division/cell wall cluster transcriptional repressor MraZ [Altererythrobacter sp. C41]MBM0170109.1 division/cell wall cluster transcriptional repressor MraZ [Altererythrobacter sp. C41]